MTEKEIKLIKDSGFFTVESLIYTPNKDLEGKLVGIGPKKVEKIIVSLSRVLDWERAVDDRHYISGGGQQDVPDVVRHGQACSLDAL